MSTSRTIVIGGGLAGLSAAHTLQQKGINVILLDKKPFLGGNSVKASSGINGAGTKAQTQHGIKDSVEAFAADTTVSAGPALARPHLIDALTSNSAPSIAWLVNDFGVDLSLVAMLGGHSVARTHRGKGGAPGWVITSTLIKKLESYAQSQPDSVKVVKGAKVVQLLEEGGRVIGVEYTVGDEKLTEHGSVIIATGGYAADFAEGGFLATHRPDLTDLPTTNGDHATGDGHRLALVHHGVLCDMDQVQVHPTGFVDPKDPTAKTKFLAAEALRGVGGLLVDAQGRRFVNELDLRDAVTAKMQELGRAGRAPIRLILNTASYEVLKAHCDFYISKGLMRKYNNAREFTAATGIALDKLQSTFESHERYAKGIEKDPFGKVSFGDGSYTVDQPIYVGELTPVVHYTMGGITVDASAHVLDAQGHRISGLYAAGEAIGGVHGKNRLGGSSLLEAVVFGRLAGASAASER
ncbi:Flavocytochrome c [Fistulina hepatica ATCC 64428]|uniref:Fumarate reductase n=1 Tax=Fistulina hepatica ATCC 64428 TaxID=1128425 RepID=A0A0D7AQF0_9AGAR|nr:Flavocytochrome c [Fistulina hepatica ATCC 64428]